MIKVHVNHKEIEIEEKSSCSDLAKKLNLSLPEQALAAKINGKLVDLSTQVKDRRYSLFYKF